jgi:hypothetical protein
MACACGSRAINDDPQHVLCDRCWRDAEIGRLNRQIDAMHAAGLGPDWTNTEIGRLRAALEDVLEGRWSPTRIQEVLGTLGQRAVEAAGEEKT